MTQHVWWVFPAIFLTIAVGWLIIPEETDVWRHTNPPVPHCTPQLNYYEVTVAESDVDPTIDLFRERGWTNIQSGPYGDHYFVSGECHA